MDSITITASALRDTARLRHAYAYHFDAMEFFGPPGKEHYRLLAYLAGLFKDSLIVDIGTHMGCSALALSTEVSNRVETFDVMDKLSSLPNSVLKRDNVTAHIADVFSDAGLETYGDLLLSAALIVVDVDPHNGDMEWLLYNWLRKKEYKGLVFFDDVHYFEGMRSFWSKVDSTYKHDLSSVGHFSGSGLVSFSPLTVTLEV